MGDFSVGQPVPCICQPVSGGGPPAALVSSIFLCTSYFSLRLTSNEYKLLVPSPVYENPDENKQIHAKCLFFLIGGGGGGGGMGSPLLFTSSKSICATPYFKSWIHPCFAVHYEKQGSKFHIFGNNYIKTGV